MGTAVRRRRRARHRRGGREGARAADGHRPSPRDAESLSEEIAVLRRRQDAGARVSRSGRPCPTTASRRIPDITSARLATLAELPRARTGVWVVAIDTLLQRLAPRSYIEAHSLRVHVGETLDLEALARAARAGRVRRRDPGGRARGVRGPRLAARRLSHGIGRAAIASICWIGTSTASGCSIPIRSAPGDKLERIELLPARETPLDPDAVREFRRRYRLRFTGDLTEQTIYRDVSAGRAPGGMEFLPAAVLRAHLDICSNTCRRRAC